MRILHVIPGLTTGGAEAVLYRLATASSGTAHEVICLEGRAWYSQKLEEQGITVHHIDWPTIGTLAALRRLHRLIRSTDADVIQTWMYRANLFAGLSARFSGKPVVWNIRCSTVNVLPLKTRVLAYAGGLADRWIPGRVVNCSAVSEQLHARIGYRSAPGVVIPNGYDPEQFQPNEAARSQSRKALGIAGDSFVIGTIGRWHVQKGIPDLLAAARALADRGIAVKLLLVGRGLEQGNAELTELIRRTRCEGLVQLLGERSDIPDIARVLDLHVLASVGAEGFPNSVAETMLSGTPNVATDVGDAKLIVDDTGWIVPPADVEGLASAIEGAHEEWSARPDRWRARQVAARRRIEDHFSLGRMVEAYEKVWGQVVRAE